MVGLGLECASDRFLRLPWRSAHAAMADMPAYRTSADAVRLIRSRNSKEVVNCICSKRPSWRTLVRVPARSAMLLPLHWIDAFTDKLFAGNPAAVVPLPHWIAESVMQQVAAEN